MPDEMLARRRDPKRPLVPITGRGECRNFRLNLFTAPAMISAAKRREEMTDQQARHTILFNGLIRKTQPTITGTVERM